MFDFVRTYTVRSEPVNPCGVRGTDVRERRADVSGLLPAADASLALRPAVPIDLHIREPLQYRQAADVVVWRAGWSWPAGGNDRFWPGAAGHRARTCDRCPTNCRHSTPSGRGFITARACTVAKAGRCHLRSGRRRREAFRRTEEPRRHPDAAGRQEPPDTAWIRAGRHRIPYSTRWRCLLFSEDQPTGNR